MEKLGVPVTSTIWLISPIAAGMRGMRQNGLVAGTPFFHYLCLRSRSFRITVKKLLLLINNNNNNNNENNNNNNCQGGCLSMRVV